MTIKLFHFELLFRRMYKTTGELDAYSIFFYARHRLVTMIEIPAGRAS